MPITTSSLSFPATFRFLVTAGLFPFLLGVTVAEAKDRVELELATAPGFSPLETQRWYRVLKDLDVDQLNIRSLKATDKLETVSEGTATRRTYKVTGVLTADNELHLPGGARFKQRDGSKLAAWLEKLRTPDTKRSGAGASLGIDEATLKVLAEALSQPVKFGTREIPLDEVASKLATGLDVSVRMDSAHRRTLSGEAPLDVELRGVATGTALAYTLGLGGLALEPREVGGRPSLAVVTPTTGRGSWPIGMPADSKRRELAPNLYSFINVEIEKGTKLATALPAIGGKLEIPLLIDHNSLAKAGIDLTKTEVFIPPRRSTLGLILNSVLGQAKLKYELRTDDGGDPFLWITTFRPS